MKDVRRPQPDLPPGVDEPRSRKVTGTPDTRLKAPGQPTPKGK